MSTETGRLFRSLHFGPKRLIRCPLDNKWRMASNVNSADLTEEEVEQAREHRL